MKDEEFQAGLETLLEKLTEIDQKIIEQTKSDQTKGGDKNSASSTIYKTTLSDSHYNNKTIATHNSHR